MAAELQFWIGFGRVRGVGPARLRRLLDHFGSLELAWRASAAELIQAGLEPRVAEGFCRLRPSLSPERELDLLWRHGITALTWDDPAYPGRLREIPASPPVLYVRGTLTADDSWAVAMVGTRRATAYGREAAERIASDSARSGIVVVSGLARGIDTAAHRAALAAGGRTLAVQGCGLDQVYPAENTKLAQAIMEQGALLSDYPLGVKPDAANFPPRNRIISGLSLGVVVVEAPEASGAQITVSYALEQNREVFAVPGSILSTVSRGTNRLIQEGAKLVMSAQDVLEELQLQMAPQQQAVQAVLPESDLERLLLGQLSAEPAHIDDIRRQTGLPIAEVSSALAIMELKGLVRQVGGMNYVLTRDH